MAWAGAVGFFVRFVGEQERKAQIEAERWKCRGCGRKERMQTPFCGWCGIEGPMRGILEEEGDGAREEEGRALGVEGSKLVVKD